MAEHIKVAILAHFPLHVIPAFGEEFRPQGHYGTWFPQIAEAFEKFRDMEIHWVVLDSRLGKAREILWRNQHFHILPTATRHRASTLFRKDRAALRKVLREIQPDLVHGWGTEDIYAIAAATSGYPNIVSMQGILSHYVLKNKMSPRVYFQALLELIVLWRADRVTVESQWGEKCLQRRNPFARISLVEYGVQSQFFDEEWSPDPEKPVAIFIGSINPRKGIQDLVAAFRNPSLAGSELWVVGGDSGPWGEGLRADASANVRWLGRKTSQETAGLLGRAWCLALPTRADTSPNVVKEARVIGLPVITTPCGGQASYIEDGRNGFFVAPGDVQQLTKCLAQLLCDFATTKKMGAYRHEEQRAWFNPENTALGFLHLYHAVVKS